MKVSKIVKHFFERGSDWMLSQTDGIIAGDPEKDVDRCLVTWMPSFKALRYMVEHNFELLICHEALFWTGEHIIDETDPDIAVKAAYIRDNNLTVVRIHDGWDSWPEIGIPWAWAKFLGIDSAPVAMVKGGVCQQRYDIEPIAVGELVKSMAKRCAAVGEPMLQFAGDKSQVVSKIGINTGGIGDIDRFIQMGCDCSVTIDEFARTTGGGGCNKILKAKDINHPVICVDHGTAEEPGMVTLTQYINDSIEGLAAEHLPHGSTFRLIG
ncbi:MAG: hypothetical protein DRQ57_18560 [Gammaproteobacteria bacterium]|nr:MAG: hypothetical protein DRQ57_18560 [Gammaproteobacteria bacterium]